MKVIMDVLGLAMVAALGAAPGFDGGMPAVDAGSAISVAVPAVAVPAVAQKLALNKNADAGTTTPDGKLPSEGTGIVAADVKPLVDRMQAFYEQTQDFTASFRQDYTYKAFKRTQSSSGTVAFKKPGLMRWEYAKPVAKTFVLAGDKVYAHDPQAMTLTVGTFDSSQLSASVTFLFGRGKLADEFDIAKGQTQTPNAVQLVLTPRNPDPRFKKIRLDVDAKTAQVVKSIVTDPDGSENAITFSGLQVNTGIAEGAFKLTPPPNTQILDMTRGK